jgi:hypothetical protein
MLVILVGRGLLYVNYTIRQMLRAMEHDRNRCSTVSIESQKQNFLHTFQFRLARLYLVSLL